MACLYQYSFLALRRERRGSNFRVVSRKPWDQPWYNHVWQFLNQILSASASCPFWLPAGLQILGRHSPPTPMDNLQYRRDSPHGGSLHELWAAYSSPVSDYKSLCISSVSFSKGLWLKNMENTTREYKYLISEICTLAS